MEESALKSDVNYVALKLKRIEEDLKRESAAFMVGFDNIKQPVSVLGTGKGYIESLNVPKFQSGMITPESGVLSTVGGNTPIDFMIEYDDHLVKTGMLRLKKF